MKITVYSKENCSLCAKALELIERLRGDYKFDLEVIDISESEQTWEKYRYFVPVIAMDGNDVLYGRIEEESMRELLDRSRKSPSSSSWALPA